MNDLIIWAMVCFFLAVILFFAEAFIPSGGLLGVLAAAAAVGGVLLMFGVNTTAGLIAGIACLAATPILVGLMIKIWPDTIFARMLTLGPVSSDAPDDVADGDSATVEPADDPRTLVGAEGKALTDLRPVGTCNLNGRREQCFAIGGVIERGDTVRVIHADGMQIKVERTGRG
ncbi:MAG: NfeD family protein [Phycisphaeraceae bacterium]|nr:NfeD family protein [Phycisphaeraceae bacterium]